MRKKPYRSLANEIDIDDPPKNYNKLVEKYIDVVIMLEIADRKITSLNTAFSQFKEKMQKSEMQYCEALNEYYEEIERLKNDSNS